MFSSDSCLASTTSTSHNSSFLFERF
uniref:Uncharacterized protein n=1 Tax=Anguilla anguilla TaxID=7936 RepID=A0A0E9T0R0_ANGAN